MLACLKFEELANHPGDVLISDNHRIILIHTIDRHRNLCLFEDNFLASNNKVTLTTWLSGRPRHLRR